MFTIAHHSVLLAISVVFLLQSTEVVVSVTEKEILLQFKAGVTDDPFGKLSSWVSEKDMCRDFEGVYCNSGGSVDRIVLWNASLGGELSPSLSKLRSLRVLTVFGNRFTGNIPEDYVEIRTLWKINVSSNLLSGNVPEFLGSLPNVRFLDLSRNLYSGSIPIKLFDRCEKAKFVSLSHNALTGMIPESICNCSSLEGFDFAFNSLSGELPEKVCEINRLKYLSVRSNTLSGRVDDRLIGCGSLELLDLGSNLFTGQAPFGVLPLNNVTYFNVSYNGFDGEVGTVSSCGERLEFLDASGNGISGEIPFGFSSCTSLKLLDMSFNRLSGNVPEWIGKLKNLLVISLGNNSLIGTIPREIGTIDFLLVLDVHNLSLVGQIPTSICSCRYLRVLDVSGNALTGKIPACIDNMTSLEVLDVHRNELNGTIPASIGSLPELKVLDLTNNHLSGVIPPSLGNLTLLTWFNVSYNNLSGSVPSAPKLQVFGLTAFFNNPGLCGSPLNAPCSANDSSGTRSKRNKKLTVSAIVAIIAAAVIFTGVCIISVINIRARQSRQEDETTLIESSPMGSSDIIIGKLVLFSKALPSRYENWEAGTKALLDKNCLIGTGSVGVVYKASLEGGVSVAVKKLETLGRIRNQDEFEFEIGRLGNLRNSNLVTCQGYYWSSTTQLILSEFVPNGNLFDNLHRVNYPESSRNQVGSNLNWPRRFHIALGTAKALAYLHHDCIPQILHLNVKASNILLNANYSPKLSDYGLIKFLPILDTNSPSTLQNTSGYIAPELIHASKFSDKTDVYSFGIILLELVTGKKPVEASGANGVIILCEHVRQVLEMGTVSVCFDRRLRGFAENELIQVMKLGLICTSETPARRPSMAEAVQLLESIRTEMESS